MAPTHQSIQERADGLLAAQAMFAENAYLLSLPVIECVEHNTVSAGLSTVFAIDLGGVAEAFLKPFGRRDVGGVSLPYLSANSCKLHGHELAEVPLNEVTASQLALRLGGSVARVVAPCVLRDLPRYGLSGSLSAARYGLSAKRHGEQKMMRVVGRDRTQSMAAAFFDSLIAQQDRHLGNFRWLESGWTWPLPGSIGRYATRALPEKRYQPHGLGLIDHGFAFARPADGQRAKDYDQGRSVFVEWRHQERQAALTRWEREALSRLIADRDLFGLRSFLEPDRAEALERRAQRMLSRSQILTPRDW